MSYEIAFAGFVGFLACLLVDLLVFLYCTHKATRKKTSRQPVIEKP